MSLAEWLVSGASPAGSKGTSTMSNKIIGVSVDCADAAAMARFWGAVLGRRVAGRATSEEAVLLADNQATSGPQLAFHQVPEAKIVKNRLHLDLITENLEAETLRLFSLGARRLRDVHGDRARWTTFADVEGNEFDLIAG
jgi:catechol 2,3-dioxygenase-like lactoylglutathione lyase family enzyme